ncbi:MAG: peptidoglycan-binding protein, partial [Alphaproteobacteria bacterium]
CRPLAEQGLADAQLILGELNQRGLGVAQDNQEAVRWFRAAAEQGLPQAQFNLGMAYRYGSGVGQDLREAYAWLTLAADAGLDDAKAARELTARRMSASELAAARALVAERRGPTTVEPVAKETASPAPTARELVAAVQTRLAKLGYEPGPADGLMGGKTRTAISSFQRTAGLTVDGRPSEALLAELNKALAAAGTAEPATGLAETAAAAPEAVAETVTGERTGRSAETQQLVEDLSVRLARAEAERSASRSLLDDLRAIVRRYEWPWTDRRLDDDFADGNHTSDPAWTVVSGRFAVAAMGLETRHSGTPAPAASPDEGDLGAQLFGAIVREVLKSQAGTGPAANPEIYTRVGFANAFVVTVRLVARPNENRHNRVVLGAFQTADRQTGYGLAYSPGAAERIELLRIAEARETVIATASPPTRLDDGGIHELQWRRNEDGEMSIWLDGTETARVVDGVLGGRFSGLKVVNEGGDYTFRRIVVHAVSG